MGHNHAWLTVQHFTYWAKSNPLLTVCVIFAATQVVVALQHEDGRVQGTFSPTTSLWDVVRQLAGRPPDEEQTEPLLVYMNQQVGEAT